MLTQVLARLAYGWLWWGGIPGLNFIIRRVLPLVLAGVVIFVVGWFGWFLLVKFFGAAYDFGSMTYRDSLKQMFTLRNLVMFFPLLFTACMLGGVAVFIFSQR